MQNIRTGALVALIVAAAATAAATAGVAAFTAAEPGQPSHAVMDGWLARLGAGVLDPAPAARDATLSGTPEAAPAAPSAPEQPVPPTPPATEVAGIASNYPGTAGWIGAATVALPGDLGGRYTGRVNGHVTVCADRCARLPVVDWCQCYWGTADQRIVDLSHPAWSLVSDAPLAEGLVEVRIILER